MLSAAYSVGTLAAGAPGNGLNRAPSSSISMRLPVFGLWILPERDLLWKRVNAEPAFRIAVWMTSAGFAATGAGGHLIGIGGIGRGASKRENTFGIRLQ